MKNKPVAAVLALLLGIFGVHRFYLDQRGLGVMMLVAFFITLALSISDDAPFVMIPAIIAFIDAVLLFVMPQEEFDRKYNTVRVGGRKNQPRYDKNQPVYRTAQKYYRREPIHGKPRDPNRKLGIKRFRAGDYDGAIEAFQDSLDENYESPSTHFNLACAFSMIHCPEDAFFHLEKAIELGFDNLKKLETHPALDNLRRLPEYDNFVANDYRIVSSLPAANTENDLLNTSSDVKPTGNDLLDQLLQLAELKEKGLLTEEEFTKQKRKLLEE